MKPTAVRQQATKDRIIAGILFLTAIALLLPLRGYVAFIPEEGIAIHAAQRVMAGQIPYRDFFSLPTPGTPLLLAAELRLLGNTLLTAQTVLLLYAGSFAALTYLLARRMYGRGPSLFATYLAVGTLASIFLFYHNWDSTVCALLGVFAAHALIDSRARRWAYLLGAAVSLTTLFEQSKGAGLLLGLAMATAALFWTRNNLHWLEKSHLCAFGAGIVTPLLSTAVYFAHHGALRSLALGIVWPVRHYSTVNRVPFGFVPAFSEILPQPVTNLTEGLSRMILACLFGAIPALCLALVFMTVFWIWYGRTNDEHSSSLDHQILAGCLGVGVLLSVCATRQDQNHLAFALPLFAYVAPGIFDMRKFDTRHLSDIRTLLATYLVLAFGLFIGTPLLRHGAGISTAMGRVTTLPRVAETIGALEARVEKGQHLYVHPYQPYFYSVTATHNPTSFDFLFPGMSTPEQYRQVVRELAQDGTPVIIFDPKFSQEVPTSWPSTPAAALAFDPVADYIVANYRLCNVLGGRYWFMTRKDLDCPP